MILTSDVIEKVIKDSGYKSIKKFCEKNNINYFLMKINLSKNIWTKPFLDVIGKALNKDLSMFVNSYVGHPKGSVL